MRVFTFKTEHQKYNMTLYSHSRLSTFEQCKLKFKYKYLDKVETELEQSIEAFLGSTVHKTLEKLYKDLKFQKPNTLEELLGYFNSEWKKNWNKEIIIVRKDYTGENYRKMGEQFIKDYYQKHYPFNQARTIDLEKRIIIKLDKHGLYKLQGYIDRLASPKDGLYEIHDYKTNASLPLEEYLKEDRQLALYSIAVKQMYQDAKDVKLIWHFLAPSKDVVITKTEEELEKLKQDTTNLIKEIEQEEEFRPKVSALCEWCEFKPICPQWSHLNKIEKMEPEKFSQDDGVKLVNQYAEIHNQKKHLEDKLDQLKEDIIRFSKENNVNSVFGADHKVSVYTYNNFKFPAHDDEKREILEKLINQFGLWKDVSKIDLIKLSNLIKTKRLPPEVLKEIERFYTEDETKIVKVSKFEKKEY